MSNFKVGDQVRLDGRSIETVAVVGWYYPATSGIDAVEYVIVEGEEKSARPASRFTLVPPEKPKYRLEAPGSSVVWAKIGTLITALAYYGPKEAAKTRERAEAMVRAAMSVVGYEEAS